MPAEVQSPPECWCGTLSWSHHPHYRADRVAVGEAELAPVTLADTRKTSAEIAARILIVKARIARLSAAPESEMRSILTVCANIELEVLNWAAGVEESDV